MEPEFSLHTDNFTIHVVSCAKEISVDNLKILTIEEQNRFENIVSNTRKNEFVTTRLLLKDILRDNYIPIQYEESGKPYLQNNQISISHSKGYVAIILSKKSCVAIDVEQYRKTIFSIAHKFVNESEEAIFSSLEDLILLWSAKETLYKFDNASPDFKEHYTVTKVSENGQYGKLLGNIHTENIEKQIELSYFRHSQFSLVWTYSES